MKSDIEQLFENAGVSLPNENSLGEKIVPDDDPVKLANFWNWFGDSKCVNKYNEPLVVYHGTGFEFNSFKTDRPIFFSDNIDVAKWFYIYGKGDAMHRNMHKAYLLMNNPLVIDANKSIFGDIQYNGDKFSAEDIANYAKKNGYDSVIIKNVKEAAYEEILCNDFIVFSSNQIKSIKNNGNFSGSDNIYESIENIVKKKSNLPNENSLGEKIVPDDDHIKLQNFWEWFNGSKIITRSGKPLVVYHGSNAEFSSFDKEQVKGNGSYWSDGFYFTTYNKPNEKNEYNRGASRYGKNVYAVYLSMKNPFVLKTYKDGQRLEDVLGIDSGMNKADKIGDSWAKWVLGYRSELTQEEIRERLLKAGYDGIINASLYSKNEVYIIAFEPNQIKSIKNNGNFSGSDNIYESIEYAEMLEDGNMFEVHKNPSDKEFWDLMRDSRYKKLRALVSVDEKERVCFVWDAYYGGTHNDILGKYLVKYNQNMSHYAQVYCTEKGIEVFGFCPEWFKETYYKPIYSKDEIENISKAFQDIFDDDDLGLLK